MKNRKRKTILRWVGQHPKWCVNMKLLDLEVFVLSSGAYRHMRWPTKIHSALINGHKKKKLAAVTTTETTEFF